jgi:hypothetical protein
MKRLWLIPVIPALVLGFVWLVGILLGPHYSTSATISLEATPESIAEVLRTVENYPRWRSDVTAVKMGKQEPVLFWTELNHLGKPTTFSNSGSRLPEKWVSHFENGEPSMQASRVFLLVALEAGGTQIAVKEAGEIKNPFSRFLYRFQTGYADALEKFLVDLRKRLGE